jgi:hypothetical protein
MTAQQKQDQELAELAHLLDTYGGDIPRWPTSRQPAARAILDTVTKARLMLDDARALDRALDTAREPATTDARAPAAIATMADRITAAAQASTNPNPFQATAVTNVVALPPRRPAPATQSYANLTRQRKVAALLAACLLAGIWLGGAVPLGPMLQDVADAVGVLAEFDQTTMAFAEDMHEEDQL